MIFNMQLELNKKINLRATGSAVLKFFSDENLKANVESFLGETKIEISSTQLRKFFGKDSNELRTFPSDSHPSILILRKIKREPVISKDFFRDCVSAVVQSLKSENLTSLQIQIPDYQTFAGIFPDEKLYLQSFTEGALLGNYTYDEFKSKKTTPKKLLVSFVVKSPDKFKNVLNVTKNLIESVSFSRDLVNEPANTLTPKQLYLKTKKELSKFGVKVTTFNKAELKKRKMGAILAVASGSENDPYLIQLHYKPKSKAKKKIALVGKGVTFDSGGLSIKPTKGMLEMKADMAGGAAVIGIVKAAAMNKLPIEIFGVVPAVENMISGKSFKPSDVIKTASGKSIEVLDTDAEGRLVLADALEFASAKKPDVILDFATLTGAVAVALGLIAAGLFSKNDDLSEKLLDAGTTTHERLWRMPFWDDYNSLLESDIADVANLGPRWGGAITAGKFLEHFVDKNIPWAHIDLAGPAIQHKSTSYTEKYHTGFGVRLIYEYLTKI